MTVVGMPMVAMPSSRFMALMATMKPAAHLRCGVSEKGAGEVDVGAHGIAPEDTADEPVARRRVQAPGTPADEEMSAAENHSAAAGPEPMSAAAVATRTMARARAARTSGR